jgi:hypothetical protein
VAQNMDQLWVLVNTEMNFSFHKRQGINPSLLFSAKALFHGVTQIMFLLAD